MPNAKRASMREGPLAALFRKTAEDTALADAQPRPLGAQAADGREPASREVPHPSLEAPATATAAAAPAAGAPASRYRRCRHSRYCRCRRSGSQRPRFHPGRTDRR